MVQNNSARIARASRRKHLRELRKSDLERERLREARDADAAKVAQVEQTHAAQLHAARVASDQHLRAVAAREGREPLDFSCFEQCPTCDGDGTVLVAGVERPCPTCCGVGRLGDPVHPLWEWGRRFDFDTAAANPYWLAGWSAPTAQLAADAGWEVERGLPAPGGSYAAQVEAVARFLKD